VRVRVFVDYWNFALSMNQWRDRFPLDWKRLGPELSGEASRLVDPTGTCTYEEMCVYVSCDPHGDGSFRRWLELLDTFPGLKILQKDRKAKNPPKCPSCHQEVRECPYCQASMRGKVEKGIDTAIVTDMIRLAWESAYDVAVLVTSDRDFIPAAEFIGQKGLKVVNAFFPGIGRQLAQKCWGSFDVTHVLTRCQRQQ